MSQPVRQMPNIAAIENVIMFPIEEPRGVAIANQILTAKNTIALISKIIFPPSLRIPPDRDRIRAKGDDNSLCLNCFPVYPQTR